MPCSSHIRTAPQAHTNVIRRLLTMSKRGTEVIYVTGNHDEFLRRYSSLLLGNIQLVDEAVHVTADGRQLLVIHGDQFDNVVLYHKWIAFLGDGAYTLLLPRGENAGPRYFPATNDPGSSADGQRY